MAESRTREIAVEGSFLVSQKHYEQRQCGSEQATIGNRNDWHYESKWRKSPNEAKDEARKIQEQRDHFCKAFYGSLATALHHPEATRNVTDTPPIEQPVEDRKSDGPAQPVHKDRTGFSR